jgi:hypothetical protein
MKRIRVTIDNGIDSDCNLLTREIDVIDAQRVYSKGTDLKIVPKSGEEITIEFNKEILYVEGIEV